LEAVPEIWVKNPFQVEDLSGNIFGEANYPSEFFDFIHISHVIEHVLDPRAYPKGNEAILKSRRNYWRSVLRTFSSRNVTYQSVG